MLRELCSLQTPLKTLMLLGRGRGDGGGQSGSSCGSSLRVSESAMRKVSLRTLKLLVIIQLSDVRPSVRPSLVNLLDDVSGCFGPQTSVPGNRNNARLENLRPDTLHSITVEPVYPEGPGAQLSGSGRTGQIAALQAVTHVRKPTDVANTSSGPRARV